RTGWHLSHVIQASGVWAENVARALRWFCYRVFAAWRTPIFSCFASSYHCSDNGAARCTSGCADWTANGCSGGSASCCARAGRCTARDQQGKHWQNRKEKELLLHPSSDILPHFFIRPGFCPRPVRCGLAQSPAKPAAAFVSRLNRVPVIAPKKPS